MEPTRSPKQLEHEHFTRELESERAQGLGMNAYERLIIIANPEFLGTLRRVAGSQVQEPTGASLDKDFTRLGTVELEQRLAPILHA